MLNSHSIMHLFTSKLSFSLPDILWLCFVLLLNSLFMPHFVSLFLIKFVELLDTTKGSLRHNKKIDDFLSKLISEKQRCKGIDRFLTMVYPPPPFPRGGTKDHGIDNIAPINIYFRFGVSGLIDKYLFFMYIHVVLEASDGR